MESDIVNVRFAPPSFGGRGERRVSFAAIHECRDWGPPVDEGQGFVPLACRFDTYRAHLRLAPSRVPFSFLNDTLI